MLSLLLTKSSGNLAMRFTQNSYVEFQASMGITHRFTNLIERRFQTDSNQMEISSDILNVSLTSPLKRSWKVNSKWVFCRFSVFFRRSSNKFQLNPLNCKQKSLALIFGLEASKLSSELSQFSFALSFATELSSHLVVNEKTIEREAAKLITLILIKIAHSRSSSPFIHT